MKVLHVSWEYPPRLYGGLGRHVADLTRAQVHAGLDVGVLTPALPDNASEPPPDAGPQILRAHPTTAGLHPDLWVADVLDAGVAMARRALDPTERHRPDVVHVHDWMAGHAGQLLAQAWGVPLVTTIHATERGRHQGFLPPGISPWIDEQERQLIACSDQVVVCADHMREHLIQHLGAPGSTIAVIPGGVDVATWALPRAHRNPGARVVYAGRLEYEKGIHVLLDAVAALVPSTDLTVTIAGQGTYGVALRGHAVEILRERRRRAGSGGAGPRVRIRFVGHLRKHSLVHLMAGATVAVVPSLYEPFGLTALEAMAAGVPVIASDTGGPAEVVAGAGVLVPPGDAAALEAALSRLLVDRPARARLQAQGAARAAAFTWQRSAAQTIELYRRVTPPRPVPSDPPPR